MWFEVLLTTGAQSASVGRLISGVPVVVNLATVQMQVPTPVWDTKALILPVGVIGVYDELLRQEYTPMSALVGSAR